MKRTRTNTDAALEELPLPFTSTAQTTAFLFLLISILALPVVITYSGSITRRHSYEIMPENQGAYSFVMSEIFDNKEDIDILFVGSSICFEAIDPVYVRDELSSAIGRSARVMLFGHYFNSIDVQLMQIRDLLARKRVRLLVLSVPRMPYTDGPSTTAYRFLRYSDDEQTFNQLPLKYQLTLYAGSVLRVPRDLLTLIRPNQVPPSPFAPNFGADKAVYGMKQDPRAFVRFTPLPPKIDVNEMIYGPSNRHLFSFTNEPIPYFQNFQFKEMIRTLNEYDIPIMMLNIPQYGERHNTVIRERLDWAIALGQPIPLVGVSPKSLFAGLSEAQIEHLHFDDDHFNMNGNEFFTRAITPAVLEIYRTHAAKDH